MGGIVLSGTSIPNGSIGSLKLTDYAVTPTKMGVFTSSETYEKDSTAIGHSTGYNTSGASYVGQTFLVGASDVMITKVTLYCEKKDTGTCPNLIGNLYLCDQITHKPTGSSLASFDVAKGDITSNALNTFTFSNAVLCSATMEYAIVFNAKADAGDGSNHISPKGINAQAMGGSVIRSSDSGGTWWSVSAANGLETGVYKGSWS